MAACIHKVVEGNTVLAPVALVEGRGNVGVGVGLAYRAQICHQVHLKTHLERVQKLPFFEGP